MFKRLSAVLIVVSLFLTLPACRFIKRDQNQDPLEEITLTFYGLYDNEELYEPLIQAYESDHPNVTVLYKKFTNPEDYLSLIINELAEGEGPDIFMLHNTWFPRHYKKLSPAPSNVISPEVFRSLFVEITGKELIIPNDMGLEQIWGLPLYVDTLALYYNQEHIEDALASRGHPSPTWAGIKEDVSQLNRQDQSFERFERAGIALGRADNILRAFDALMLMMLQYKVNFYTEDLKTETFSTDPNALSALELYTSFALPSQKNYSWNKYLADPESAEKELTTFAKGKLSMILGFSFTYEALVNEISRLKAEGEASIDLSDIEVQEVPQVYDPETSAETRETYASYYVPVVSRTTEHGEEAWNFLVHLVTEENLTYYHEVTHRPSARRNLIETQMLDPIYGVFAAQVGYAESIPMADPEKYKEIFLEAVNEVLNTIKSQIVLSEVGEQIQSLIPSDGIKPVYVPSP